MHGFASNVLSCEERERQVSVPAAASELSGTGGVGCARKEQARLANHEVGRTVAGGNLDRAAKETRGLRPRARSGLRMRRSGEEAQATKQGSSVTRGGKFSIS